MKHLVRFAERRIAINKLSEQLKKSSRSTISDGVKHRIENLFEEVQHMLMEILDLEKRNEVGGNAFAIFKESILGEVPFLQLRTQNSLESMDVMLHIFQRGPNTALWREKDVVIDWLDRVLWHMPTLSAYRARHDLTSDIINQNLQIDTPIPLDCTLVYDAVGMVTTKILNTIARVGAKLNLVYTDPKTIYQIQYALTGRMGRIQLQSHRLSSVLSAVLGDESILPNDVPLHSQRLIVINGLMDTCQIGIWFSY